MIMKKFWQILPIFICSFINNVSFCFSYLKKAKPFRALVFSEQRVQNVQMGSLLEMGSLLDSTSTKFYKSLEQKLLTLDSFEKVEIPDVYKYSSGELVKSKVEFSCNAFKGTRWIRYLRIIKFIGKNYDVLNIMAVPFSNNSLPILGIDTVVLPGKTVIAIDLQPAQICHLNGDFIYPNNMQSLFNKYNAMFPSISSNFPPEAKPFFSSCAILSLIDEKNSTMSINIPTQFQSPNFDDSYKHTPVELCVQQAILDYTNEYKHLIDEATENMPKEIVDQSINKNDLIEHITARKKALYSYLDYRTRKDPAKNLLMGAFGKEWTEGALNYFFPQDDDNIM